jgi:maltooligosyltrehalose trehalohydrolase
MKIGAFFNDNGSTSFTVWAPRQSRVSVKIVYPKELLLPMKADGYGYWHIDNVDVTAGARYYYQLGDYLDRPDPASRFQSQGVHGPSEVISPFYDWHDLEWNGIALEKYIIYELHIGTFTKDGTFDAAIGKINYLKDLGITAIELMPVAQFPGSRNWGYDGAYHFAVQNSYGGPEGLKRFVDECHKNKIAVVLDVVYNHFGPEGTYVNEFGYYFTEKYHTPWGSAINFDDSWSDGVRNYFFQNAIEWFSEYHIDALRLDAIHGIFDFGGNHFLHELAQKTEEYSIQSGRKRFLIAESDLNDTRVILPYELNGYGLDAQWHDDFHHAIIALVTGERKSYYGDFGSIEQLEKAYRDGFVYSWEYSRNRKRHHGTSSVNIPGKQFVVCIQNHDQVGNRLLGERVSQLVPFEALKLLTGALLVSPYVPLLFMGEEFAADTPFMYFISHGDENLVKAVREGRAREFAEFHCNEQSPDPQSEEIFNKCKINWNSLHLQNHETMYRYYKKLISLRKDLHSLSKLVRNNLKIYFNIEKTAMIIEKEYNEEKIMAIMNYSNSSAMIERGILDCSGDKILDSSDELWLGRGSKLPSLIYSDTEYELAPYQFALYKSR